MQLIAVPIILDRALFVVTFAKGSHLAFAEISYCGMNSADRRGASCAHLLCTEDAHDSYTLIAPPLLYRIFTIAVSLHFVAAFLKAVWILLFARV